MWAEHTGGVGMERGNSFPIWVRRMAAIIGLVALATPVVLIGQLVQPARAEYQLPMITGYYCRYDGGFYGDGGGWCGPRHPTASGWQTIDAYYREAAVGRLAAACGLKYQLGDILRIAGYQDVVCYDRGWLAFDQVDVFYLASSQAPDTFWAQVTFVGYDPCVTSYCGPGY